jgi:hypothetical protein
MTKTPIHYEVEVRLGFEDENHARRALPDFVISSLNRKQNWSTIIFGRDLFLSGEVLRISTNKTRPPYRSYLGWKGIDQGRFANIREEVDEEIRGDVEGGYILEQLGGAQGVTTPADMERELDHLGHAPFMQFDTINHIGRSDDGLLSFKLMQCSRLSFPVLFEIEKMADSIPAAKEAESQLQSLLTGWRLLEYRVKEEPPTLLYFQHYAT